jgi:hypothetical protein
MMIQFVNQLEQGQPQGNYVSKFIGFGACTILSFDDTIHMSA